MKSFTVVLLSSIFIIPYCFSQDIITKKSGDDIEAKILEVTASEIKYKEFDDQDGPTFFIPKSEVLMVRYENGSQDIFNNDDSSKVDLLFPSNNDLYIQGQLDASKYYKGYKEAGTGTLITGLLSPLAGLIPAIACSSTQPKDINLNYPNSDLMKKPDYYNGYTQKAKKIKQGKVWTNWGIGFGANLVAVLIFIN